MDTLTTDRDGPGRDVQAGRRSPYPEEFRKDAVALYRTAAGKRTYAAVAADLGITAESLRTWARKDDSQAVPGRRDAGGCEAEEPAWLRTENVRLLKAEKEWQPEREILRRTVACFAREGSELPPLGLHLRQPRQVRRPADLPRAGVSRSGSYRHLATAQARAGRQAEEKRTVSEIRSIHAQHHGAYGAPRIHAELCARAGGSTASASPG